MKKICDTSKCCGCGACMNACPKSCILMKEENGFLVPFIEEEKCINCGICVSKCQIITELSIKHLEKPIVNAAIYKNDKVLSNSTSGAVSYAISKKIIDNGGVVYGAAFSDYFELKHICIKSEEELYKIQKSKYLQSDLGFTYSEIKTKLREGIKVLFVGTPCQVAGLYTFLGKDYENLFTIDILCYGVPSPFLFKEYINYLNKKKNKKVIKIDFRDKSFGWGNNYTRIEFEDGEVSLIQSLRNEWYRLFISHWITRESCFLCKYTTINRKSDITIGDYWGYQKYIECNEAKKGLSKVMINTTKGIKVWNSVKDDFYIWEMSIESAIRQNLVSPPLRPAFRDKTFSIIDKKGFGYILKLSIRKSVYWRLIRFLINKNLI